MASPLINVTVKSLNGDLILLHADPAAGFDPILTSLASEDPDAFPVGLTTLSFADPNVSALADGVLLLAVVSTNPIASLVLYEDEITLPGTNASYQGTYRHWQFRLANGLPLHVYNSVHSFEHEWKVSTHPQTIAFAGNTLPIQDILSHYQDSVSLQDAHLISSVVLSYYSLHNQPPLDSHTHDLPSYCTCGHLVTRKSLKAHLAGKKKHLDGDSDGKAFLAHVEAYVASLHSAT